MDTKNQQPGNMPVPNREILKHFDFTHVQDPAARAVGKPFRSLAHQLQGMLKAGPERSVALRKLMEAADAAIRAYTHPGG